MSLVKCRLAIISWPIGSFAPKKSTGIYISLGEIYDEKVKSNLHLLEELHRSLKFLYPFRIKKTPGDIKLYNEEDFDTGIAQIDAIEETDTYQVTIEYSTTNNNHLH